MAAEDFSLKMVELLEQMLGLFDLTTPEGRPQLKSAEENIRKELTELHAKLDPKWAKEQAEQAKGEGAEGGATGATGETGATGAHEAGPTGATGARDRPGTHETAPSRSSRS